MLYLIKSSTYLKIGYTYNIEKRMNQYATHNPDFILLDTAEGSLRDEENLHAILKPYWIKNEWFYIKLDVKQKLVLLLNRNYVL